MWKSILALTAVPLAALIVGFWRSGYLSDYFSDPGEQCLDAWSAAFLDPRSGRLERAYVDDGRVYIVYTATNVFGARVSGHRSCPLRSDGTFDEDAADLEVTLHRLDALTD